MVNIDLNVLIFNVKVTIEQPYKWHVGKKLTINIDKTYFALFHIVNNPGIGGDVTEIVAAEMTKKGATEIKYIGLNLDENLDYDEQVRSICKSLLKCCAISNHIKHKLNEKTARQLCIYI